MADKLRHRVVEILAPIKDDIQREEATIILKMKEKTFAVTTENMSPALLSKLNNLLLSRTENV